jgi:hypothetical protein
VLERAGDGRLRGPGHACLPGGGPLARAEGAACDRTHFFVHSMLERGRFRPVCFTHSNRPREKTRRLLRLALYHPRGQAVERVRDESTVAEPVRQHQGLPHRRTRLPCVAHPPQRIAKVEERDRDRMGLPVFTRDLQALSG